MSFLDWAEYTGIVIFFIAFAISLFASNHIILYCIAFLIGMIFGRIWWRFRSGHLFMIFLLASFVFLGLYAGNIYSSVRILSMSMLAGALLSYFLHDKKIVRTIDIA